jgi:selenocysteine insertion sequence-binding protein 2
VSDGVESDDIRLTDSSGLRQSAIVHLDNMLTEEDFEDEECLMESKRDIETLSKKYGKILNIDILMETELKGRVSITYENMEHAKTAAEQFNGMVIGGQTVIASLSSTNTQTPVPQLILKGVLTDDDFDDDDCLEETKSDLIMLLSKFGKVKTVDMELEGDRKGDVKVTFEEVSDVSATLNELNGRMFGGEKLTVILSEDTTTDDLMAFMKNNHDSSSLKTNEPMITAGGKVIPAQYAEMKRVPKIPNKGEPRAYAKQMDTDQVVPLLFDMLGELMRLQLRAKETNNTKVKRRLVLGLREVCRGIKSRKVKMVILANNLDEYGALEDKLQEILDLANENEVPVISVLNKRKIGKAVGKNIKVSVVGVENPEGAFESFKKLKKMCDK